jgi:hypothetical protein
MRSHLLPVAGQPHHGGATTRPRCHEHAVSRRPAGAGTLGRMSAWSQIEAERAFSRAARARRRAALICRLRRRCTRCGPLAVHDERAQRRRAANAPSGVREIPLDAISATVEPNRASQFDRAFRPAAPTRTRWQRIWLAEDRGTVLPPISVVAVGDTYAVRDGHHRVSVARSRGAVTIDAIVDPGWDAAAPRPRP